MRRLAALDFIAAASAVAAAGGVLPLEGGQQSMRASGGGSSRTAGPRAATVPGRTRPVQGAASAVRGVAFASTPHGEERSEDNDSIVGSAAEGVRARSTGPLALHRRPAAAARPSARRSVQRRGAGRAASASVKCQWSHGSGRCAEDRVRSLSRIAPNTGNRCAVKAHLVEVVRECRDGCGLCATSSNDRRPAGRSGSAPAARPAPDAGARLRR